MTRYRFRYSLCLLAGSIFAVGCAQVPSALFPQGQDSLGQDGAVDSLMSLARLSERHNQSENAERMYSSILESNPRNPEAHHRLGVVAAKSGQYEKAEHHLRTAAKLKTPSAELLSDIGYTLYMMGRLDEAEKTLRQSLQVAPRNEQARNNLALVLGESGRYAESLAEFKQIVSEAEAYANLAYIKTLDGDYQGAMSDYSRALSLDNDLRPAAEALLQLAKRVGEQRQLEQFEKLSVKRAAAEKDEATQVAAGEPENAPDKVRKIPAKVAGFFEVIDRPSERKTAASQLDTIANAAPAARGLAEQQLLVSRRRSRVLSAAASERPSDAAEQRNESGDGPVHVTINDARGTSTLPGCETALPAVPDQINRASTSASRDFKAAEIVYGPLKSGDGSGSTDNDAETAIAARAAATAAVAAVRVPKALSADGDVHSPSPPSPTTFPARSDLSATTAPQPTYHIPQPLTGIQTTQAVLAQADARPSPSTAGTAATPRGPEAFANQEGTSSAFTGPVLFQPLNQWQQPTWMPPIGRIVTGQSGEAKADVADVQSKTEVADVQLEPPRLNR